jgi:hypothetical protein
MTTRSASPANAVVGATDSMIGAPAAASVSLTAIA